MSLTRRINETVETLTKRIAYLTRDYAFDHDQLAETGLVRCLPLRGNVVDLDTHAMRDLYRALLHRAPSRGTDMKNITATARELLNASGTLAGYTDRLGNSESVVCVVALATAIAQWTDWEMCFKAEMDSWDESFAELGMAAVVGGMSPIDAGTVALHGMHSKPTRFWITDPATA